MKNSAKDNTLLEQIQEMRLERQTRIRANNTAKAEAARMAQSDERKKALQKCTDEDLALEAMSEKMQDLKKQERDERRAV